MPEEKLTQKDAAKLVVLSLAVGAAGALGMEVAKWASRHVEEKRVKRWWDAKAAPVLMHAGFETSKRLVTWFNKRVVTMEELRPGISKKKRTMAVDRIRTVIEE